ncbi:vascular endothelial growth factor A [Fundulus heteroclitus]|uniref:vascular endothelial growth factor A n=1 Tax=Fundulus heteroclitus TaxID=8078 RepID=UPI00165C3821|nr:vascular endothelial growth factor A [Fundulus heteroclitus]
MMHSFRDTTCLLLVLLLRLVLVQMLNLPADESPKVAMRFMEVLTKSVCRPIEKLVNVEGEFPDGVEYIYIPSCVPLFRCSGCCIDETKECYPTTKRNITLEVNQSGQYVNLTFVEHQACGVREKYTYQNDTSSVISQTQTPKEEAGEDKLKL